MDYNTERLPLKLPEYGRLVQEMVEEAKKITDKEERQVYALTIIRVMKSLKPNKYNVAHYDQKLWEHLAYMADYALDIDYPVEVLENTMFSKPASIAYPKKEAKQRQYGHLVERWLDKVAQMPAEEGREALSFSLANYMKACLVEKSGTYVTDEKVAHDMAAYTSEALTIDTLQVKLVSINPHTYKKRYS